MNYFTNSKNLTLKALHFIKCSRLIYISVNKLSAKTCKLLKKEDHFLGISKDY